MQPIIMVVVIFTIHCAVELLPSLAAGAVMLPKRSPSRMVLPRSSFGRLNMSPPIDDASIINCITGNQKTNNISKFLEDVNILGTVRFVVVGEGAILETIGNFNNLRYSNTSKGRLATVSSDNPCFECHIRLDFVKKVKFVEIVKEEGKVMRIVRFQDDNEKSLLSAIVVESSSPTNWQNLKDAYGGDTIDFS